MTTNYTHETKEDSKKQKEEKRKARTKQQNKQPKTKKKSQTTSCRHAMNNTKPLAINSRCFSFRVFVVVVVCEGMCGCVFTCPPSTKRKRGKSVLALRFLGDKPLL
mmetsp:Transcript_32829/g.63343  ORF Transcript_32829/g.63343 Transcript_32829/m.63343 type:complete len:106 (-) Transcript_32829:581-898(-)